MAFQSLPRAKQGQHNKATAEKTTLKICDSYNAFGFTNTHVPF